MLSGRLALSIDDTDLVQVVAQCPYADARDLVGLAGKSSDYIEDALKKLQWHGLIRRTFLPDNKGHWVRRWHLTGWGIVYLSMLTDKDADEIMLQHPVSLDWQRRLLRRNYIVQLMYRVARDAAPTAEGPVGWIWDDNGIMKGTLSLGNRCIFGVGMMSLLRTPGYVANVMRRVKTLQARGRLPELLMVVPTELDAQRVAAESAGEGCDIFFVAKDSLIDSPVQSPVWRGKGHSHLRMQDVVRLSKRSEWKREPALYPNNKIAGTEIPREVFTTRDFRLAELRPEVWRMLETIHDWPLLKLQDLISISRLGKKEALRILDEMAELGLTGRRKLELADADKASRQRYILSVTGLSWLADRDEVDKRWLLKTWITGKGKDGYVDKTLTGRGIRRILYDAERINLANEFVALLSDAATSRRSWELREAMPQNRWHRWLGAYTQTFMPYATIRLERRGKPFNFFLEVDDSYTITARLQHRVLRFARYAQTETGQRDFDGIQGGMLVVMRDDRQTAGLLFVAERMFREERPIFITNWKRLTEVGPFGRVWQAPWDKLGTKMTMGTICSWMDWRQFDENCAPDRKLPV